MTDYDYLILKLDWEKHTLLNQIEFDFKVMWEVKTMSNLDTLYKSVEWKRNEYLFLEKMQDKLKELKQSEFDTFDKIQADSLDDN